MTAPPRPIARQILSELDVAALTSRIIDPERTRVVVVVTSGNRAPAERLNADRIAVEAGPDVEVVALPTGTLTYALERGLPEETNVFGDAARTYPVGTSWHQRPHLSPLRYCGANTDVIRLQAQVISDARAATRRAAEAMTPAAPRVDRTPPRTPARHGGAPSAVPPATPATLPGALARRRESQGANPTAPGADGTAPEAHSPAELGTGPVGTSARTSGPTPANPRGAPSRPSRTVSGQSTSTSQPQASVDRPVARAVSSDQMPWHASSTEDGHALARHLMARRERPVLVVTTPSEAVGPRIDADDLFQRVHEIAEVVVLHNGPASWALADAMPPLTQVYGGAGRVYPIDLDWLTNPYRAPIRFCWPNDDPARVADLLEDDAYGSANLSGLTASRSHTAKVHDRGRVTGPLGRHHVLLRLDRGGQGALLIDELFPGIEPERLLKVDQVLTGRVESGHLLSPFLPDPIDDNPQERASANYTTGDVVLARVTEVAARSGRARLHPRVDVLIRADDDESDLRNLIAADDVVTLTLTSTDQGEFAAELADAEAPSVVCIPVLPGGPPWLTELDLASPEPAPELEAPAEPVGVDPEDEIDAPTTGRVASPPPLTPATLGHHAQVAGLNAQIDSLTAMLDENRRKAETLAEEAGRARKEAQKLRRRIRSLEDQHRAYRDRVEGGHLFGDPEDQLRYDIEQTWLRRTPEPERGVRPLTRYRLGTGFLKSLSALQGIGRDKVLDVLVEVLSDRAKEIPGRDLHPLRESESSQTQLVRSDGAKAWRCALQVHTPSARRLHFWKLPDGSIELDTVGTHDGQL